MTIGRSLEWSDAAVRPLDTLYCTPAAASGLAVRSIALSVGNEKGFGDSSERGAFRGIGKTGGSVGLGPLCAEVIGVVGRPPVPPVIVSIAAAGWAAGRPLATLIEMMPAEATGLSTPVPS